MSPYDSTFASPEATQRRRAQWEAYYNDPNAKGEPAPLPGPSSLPVQTLPVSSKTAIPDAAPEASPQIVPNNPERAKPPSASASAAETTYLPAWDAGEQPGVRRTPGAVVGRRAATDWAPKGSVSSDAAAAITAQLGPGEQPQPQTPTEKRRARYERLQYGNIADKDASEHQSMYPEGIPQSMTDEGLPKGKTVTVQNADGGTFQMDVNRQAELADETMAWRVGRGITERMGDLAAGVMRANEDFYKAFAKEGSITEPMFAGISSGFSWAAKQLDSIQSESFQPKYSDVGEAIQRAAQGDFGYLFGFIGENAPITIADALVTLAGAPAYLTATTADFANERAKNDGRSERTIEDYSYGFGGAVVSFVLDKILLGTADGVLTKLIGKTRVEDLTAATKSAAWKRALAGGARGVAVEAPEEAIQEAAVTYDTKKGMTAESLALAAAGGALAGGPAGAAIDVIAGRPSERGTGPETSAAAKTVVPDGVGQDAQAASEAMAPAIPAPPMLALPLPALITPPPPPMQGPPAPPPPPVPQPGAAERNAANPARNHPGFLPEPEPPIQQRQVAVQRGDEVTQQEIPVQRAGIMGEAAIEPEDEATRAARLARLEDAERRAREYDELNEGSIFNRKITQNIKRDQATYANSASAQFLTGIANKAGIDDGSDRRVAGPWQHMTTHEQIDKWAARNNIELPETDSVQEKKNFLAGTRDKSNRDRLIQLFSNLSGAARIHASLVDDARDTARLQRAAVQLAQARDLVMRFANRGDVADVPSVDEMQALFETIQPLLNFMGANKNELRDAARGKDLAEFNRVLDDLDASAKSVVQRYDSVKIGEGLPALPNQGEPEFIREPTNPDSVTRFTPVKEGVVVHPHELRMHKDMTEKERQEIRDLRTAAVAEQRRRLEHWNPPDKSEQARLSRRSLAKKTGLSASTIDDYYDGTLHPEAVESVSQKIAAALEESKRPRRPVGMKRPKVRKLSAKERLAAAKAMRESKLREQQAKHAAGREEIIDKRDEAAEELRERKERRQTVSERIKAERAAETPEETALREEQAAERRAAREAKKAKKEADAEIAKQLKGAALAEGEVAAETEADKKAAARYKDALFSLTRWRNNMARQVEKAAKGMAAAPSLTYTDLYSAAKIAWESRNTWKPPRGVYVFDKTLQDKGLSYPYRWVSGGYPRIDPEAAEWSRYLPMLGKYHKREINYYFPYQIMMLPSSQRTGPVHYINYREKEFPQGPVGKMISPEAFDHLVRLAQEAGLKDPYAVANIMIKRASSKGSSGTPGYNDGDRTRSAQRDRDRIDQVIDEKLPTEAEVEEDATELEVMELTPEEEEEFLKAMVDAIVTGGPNEEPDADYESEVARLKKEIAEAEVVLQTAENMLPQMLEDIKDLEAENNQLEYETPEGWPNELLSYINLVATSEGGIKYGFRTVPDVYAAEDQGFNKALAWSLNTTVSQHASYLQNLKDQLEELRKQNASTSGPRTGEPPTPTSDPETPPTGESGTSGIDDEGEPEPADDVDSRPYVGKRLSGKSRKIYDLFAGMVRKAVPKSAFFRGLRGTTDDNGNVVGGLSEDQMIVGEQIESAAKRRKDWLSRPGMANTVNRAGALVMNGTGTGKTRLAAALSKMLFDLQMPGYEGKPVLIVAPVGLTSKYAEEAALLGIDPKHIVTENYTHLSKHEVKGKFSAVIFDEAHNVKSGEITDETGKEKRWSPNAQLIDAPFRVFMTATPTDKMAQEVYYLQYMLQDAKPRTLQEADDYLSSLLLGMPRDAAAKMKQRDLDANEYMRQMAILMDGMVKENVMASWAMNPMSINEVKALSGKDIPHAAATMAETAQTDADKEYMVEQMKVPAMVEETIRVIKDNPRAGVVAVFKRTGSVKKFGHEFADPPPKRFSAMLERRARAEGIDLKLNNELMGSRGNASEKLEKNVAQAFRNGQINVLVMSDSRGSTGLDLHDAPGPGFRDGEARPKHMLISLTGNIAERWIQLVGRVDRRDMISWPRTVFYAIKGNEADDFYRSSIKRKLELQRLLTGQLEADTRTQAIADAARREYEAKIAQFGKEAQAEIAAERKKAAAAAKAKAKRKVKEGVAAPDEAPPQTDIELQALKRMAIRTRDAENEMRAVVEDRFSLANALDRDPKFRERLRATTDYNSPIDQHIDEEIAKQGDANDVVGAIARNDTDPALAEIASGLHNHPLLSGIRVVAPTEDLPADKSGAAGPGFIMARPGGASAVTILHEAVHQITQGVIERNPVYRARLQQIMTVAARTIAPTVEGQFTNVHEFVAEAFSNPAFQAALKGVRMPSGTLWQRFMDFVARAVGLDTRMSAFDAVMELRLTDPGNTVDMGKGDPAQQLLTTMYRTAPKEAVTAAARKAVDWRDPSFKTALNLFTFEQLIDTFGHLAKDTVRGVDRNYLQEILDVQNARNSFATQERNDYEKKVINPLRDFAIGKLTGRKMISVQMEPGGPLIKMSRLQYLAELMNISGYAELDFSKSDVDPINSSLGKSPTKKPRKGPVKRTRSHIYWELHKPQFARELGPDGVRTYEQIADYFRHQQDVAGLIQAQVFLNAVMPRDDGRDWFSLSGAEIRAAVKKLSNTGSHELAKYGVDEKLLKNIHDLVQPGRVRGAYFPLKRFGNYVVTTEERHNFTTDAEREDLLRQFVGGKVLTHRNPDKSIKSQEVVYKAMSKFETLSEAENFRAYLLAKYPNSNVSKVMLSSDIGLVEQTGLSQSLIERYTSAVMKQTNLSASDKKAQIKIFEQAMFDLLPESSYANTFRKREGVLGAALDPQRSLSTYGAAFSHYKASAAFSSQMRNVNAAFTDYIRDVENASPDLKSSLTQDDGKRARSLRLLQESVNQRIANTQDMFVEGAIWQRLSNIGFAYYLVSMSYNIINAMQPLMMTMPHLAGRFGHAKASSAMAKAYRAVGPAPLKKLAKTGFTVFELKNMFTTDFNRKNYDILSEIIEGLEKNGQTAYVKLLRKLANDNLIEATVAMDLAQGAKRSHVYTSGPKAGASRPQGMLSYLSDWMRMAPHITEVLNRSTTAIAAYEAEFDRLTAGGADAKTAIDGATAYAAKAINETQFNYQNINKPPVLQQSGFARTALMFKQHVQHMMYYMTRRAVLSSKGLYKQLRGLPMSAEDKADYKEARAQLSYLLGYALLATGAIGGVPEPAKWILGLWNMLFGDEDEPWNYELEVQQRMADWFGPQLGDVMARGLPALAGVDLTSRIGINNMLLFETPDFSSDDPNAISMSILRIAGGPMLSLGEKAFVKFPMNIRDGQFDKAIEQVTPKGIRDAARAVRMMNSGFTTYTGRVYAQSNEFSPTDFFLTAVGLTSTETSKIYLRRQVEYNVKTMTNKASDLKKQMVDAYPDKKARIQMFARIDRWNRDNPGFPIHWSDVLETAKSRATDQARTRNNMLVPVNKRAYADAEANF